MVLVIGFAELLGAVLLLTSAVSGASFADVITGKAGQKYRQAAAASAAGGSGVPQESASVSAAGMSNPFPGGWSPGRLDQGYDGTFTGQLVAPITGIITYASTGFSNWGGYINLKTPDGSNVPGLDSNTLYFAEGLNPLVKAGELVMAGQPIATAQVEPGSGNAGIAGNIEWGQAKPGSLGSPSDPLEAGAADVLTFAKWAESALGLSAPSSTSDAGAF
jgi:hypothetical protein